MLKVIQQRVNGRTSFIRNWWEYKHGFGQMGARKNFWLG